MTRIIIQNDSKQSDYNVLKAVMNVVSDGRISKDGKCYCYITTFPNRELLVAADVTRTGTDKFIVQDYNNEYL